VQWLADELQIGFSRAQYQLCAVASVVGFVVLLAVGYGLEKSHWELEKGRDGFWQGRSHRNEHEGSEYCEKHRQDEFMAEQINSLSNYGFMLFGLWTLLFGWQDALRLRKRGSGALSEGRDASLSAPAGTESKSLGAREAGLDSAEGREPGAVRREGRPTEGRPTEGRPTEGRPTGGPSAAGGAPPAAALYRYPVWSLVFALSQLVLGVSSFLFHASLSRLAQRLDVAGIYMAMCNLVGYSLVRWVPRSLAGTAFERAAHAVVVVGLVPLNWQCFAQKHRIDSFTALPALIGAVLAVNGLHLLCCFRCARVRWSLGGWALVCLLLAWFFRTGDVEGWFFCDEGSVFQGHAAWHVLCGLAYFAAVLFFRSERALPAAAGAGGASEGAGRRGGGDGRSGAAKVVEMVETPAEG
jgi:hypothetical protein